MSEKKESGKYPLPGWLNVLLVFGTIAALLLLEKKHPLRKSRENKLRHDSRNFAVAALSGLTLRLVEKPVVMPLAETVVLQRWGLLQQRRLPAGLELALAVILLDYTLFIWHYLTHRLGPLWRFHQAHHADLDLTATTAIRFHFGEMALSTPWRAAQVILIGASPLALSLWQTLTLLEILFHHANIRIPAALESRLCRLIVTPRMHGIHHSIVLQETHSNWATLFTFPDYLHGTLRLNVPQAKIIIGVPAYQNPADLTLGRIIAMPTAAARPSWRLADGSIPERTSPPSLPRTALIP